MKRRLVIEVMDIFCAIYTFKVEAISIVYFWTASVAFFNHLRFINCIVFLVQSEIRHSWTLRSLTERMKSIASGITTRNKARVVCDYQKYRGNVISCVFCEWVLCYTAIVSERNGAIREEQKTARKVYCAPAKQPWGE